MKKYYKFFITRLFNRIFTHRAKFIITFSINISKIHTVRMKTGQMVTLPKINKVTFSFLLYFLDLQFAISTLTNG